MKPSRSIRRSTHLSRSRLTRPVFEVLETRTVPSTLILNAVADGLVADRNLDGTFDTVDTTSTSVTDRYFDASYAPGIGQERGVFEFDLSGIAPGTPIVSATLGLDVLSFTSGSISGTTTYPQAAFEAYRGLGTVTTNDGASAASAAGSGSVVGLGVTSFPLTPSVLQSLEGGVVAVRLKNPTLNGEWFQVSDMRDPSNPHPVLTLVLGSNSAPPTAAGDHYTVAQGGTLTAVAPTAVPPASYVSYNFDEAATGTSQAQDGGPPPNLPGTFTGAATRTPSTPGFASTGALDLTAPGRNTVNVGHVASLDNASELTVTAWINLRTSSSNTGKQLVNYHNLGISNTSGWDLELSPANSTPASGDTGLTFNAWGATGSGQGAVSSAFLTPGKWVFVAATFSPGRVVTFYAGDTAASVSQVGQSGALPYGVTPSSTAPLIIGDPGWASSISSYLSAPAWLDDVRVFGSALTAAQVDAVRQSNLPAGVLANDTSPSGTALIASLVSGPAHGSLTLNADGTFSYTPAAGYFGPDSFTYQASDGTNTSAPATVTLNVVAPPSAAADHYTMAENGSLSVPAASGVLANDTDPNALPLTATLQGAPAHGTVTLNPDGSFVYTPAANYYGTDTFTYADSNGLVSGDAATVTVNVVAPPVAVVDMYLTAKNTPLTVAAASGVLANDTDPNGLTFTASVVSQPAHGALSFNADGSFVYTPAAGYYGTDSFTYADSNGVATSSPATVTLKVSPPSAAADSASVNENATLTVAAPGVLANDIDPNGLPLTASVVSQPTHGTLTLNGDGSYTYTPAAGYFGPDSFTYQASDGAVTSLPATVSITVNQVGSISGTVWDDLNASGARVSADPGLGGRTVFLDLNHNGTLDAGEPSATTAPDGTYTLNGVAPGTYSVVAALPTGWAQTSPFSTGSRTVTVPVQTRSVLNFSDLTSPYTRTLGSYSANGYTFLPTPSNSNAFVVWGPNSPSNYAGATALTPQSITTKMRLYRPDGQLFSVQSVDMAPLYKNGGGGVWLFGDLPGGAQVSQSGTITSTLTFTTTTFTILNNLVDVYWSQYSSIGAQFTNWVLVAGGPTAITGVDFGQARATGAAPVAAADAYTGVMGTTLTVAAPSGVLANDASPQGDPFRTTLATSPGHGTLTLNADGSFTYAPTLGFYGPDSFTYKATDGYLSSPPVTVSLTINRPPVAAADAYALAKDTTLTVAAAAGVLANDRDWNGLPMTVSLLSGPSHGSLTLNADGSFSYTPAAGYSGSDTFVYKAGDGVSSSGSTAVTLTVNPGPVAVADTYVVQAGTPLTVAVAAGVLANDVSPGGGALTATLVSTPYPGSISFNADGSFTYTPPAYPYAGPVTFTYRASDGTNSSNVATVTLYVDAPPAVTNDTYSVLSGATLTTVPGVSSLVINSQLGDSVGHGGYKTLNTSTGWFSASIGQYMKNSVTIDYNDFGYGEYNYPVSVENWSLLFVMPNQTAFVPGTYTGATRAPFQAVTAPGLDVSGDGAGANTSTGQFTVTQADYDASGNLVSFAASFTQYGDNSIAPLLGQVRYNATGNQPGGVLVNDSDAAHLAMTASLVSGPAHGVLTLNADGTFSYTPNVGYAGTDSFVYQASDGFNTSAPATVTITVVGPPVAAPDSYNVLANTPLTVAAAAGVLANDTDPNGLTMTATLVAGPSHGSVSLNADGSFTYTPATGFVGVDSFSYKANDGKADSNVVTVAFTVSPMASASFVATDTTTQGNWKGAYGTDGFSIAQDPSGNNPSLPAYATVAVAAANSYTWNGSTADPRAPQQAAAGSPNRIASTWYSGSSFNLDVNLTDGLSHRVALYALDWDGIQRAETVDVIDVPTGTVLDTRTLASFQGGAYLVWNLSGHVRLKVTSTGPGNAVATALLFGNAVVPAASAAFVATDTTTQGNWKGAYGTDGFVLAQDPSANNPSLPSYASVAVAGANSYTWAGSTADPRAPQQAAAGSTNRIASTWYSGGSFNLDVNLTDGLSHRVALYALDWDGTQRAETVEVIDVATGAVLDTRTLANFQNGVYLVWNLQGHVRLKVTNTGPSNAVAAALFLGDAVVPAASAAFVATDTTTQGNWKGTYGTDGFSIAQDPSGNNPSLPAYATVAVAGANSYTWAGSTADPRAPQQAAAGSTNRIASTWYSGSSFNLDMNLTDGLSHRVALYALDWDGTQRAETVEVIDVATGAVLDTRTLANFQNGVYLVWNLKGNVRLRVTNTGPANAVATALFFG